MTNLATANSTLTEQVSLYSNRLYTKEADNMALQTAIKNLQGQVKNLKAWVANLKKSGNSGVAGAADKDNSRMTPRWKRERQSHHSTWSSTTYCWIHGAVGHSVSECKNKRPGQKKEATETTSMGGSTFALPKVL